MNLEQVEQHCLRYLEQASNPMVPVHTLMAHLATHEEFADVTEQDLLAFLRKHEMVRVIEAGLPDGVEDTGAGAGPRVILKTRIPTKQEMEGLIQEQLHRMTAALQGALEEAVRAGDDESRQRVEELLEKSQDFKKKIDDAFS